MSDSSTKESLAFITNLAPRVGVEMVDAFVVVTRDAHPAPLEIHRAHFQLRADNAHNLAAFVEGLREHASSTCVVAAGTSWVKLLDFALPGALVTLSHVVIGQVSGQPDPRCAVLTFQPTT